MPQAADNESGPDFDPVRYADSREAIKGKVYADMRSRGMSGSGFSDGEVARSATRVPSIHCAPRPISRRLHGLPW